MKVKFCNKILWSNFIKILSATSAALSFFLAFFDIAQKVKFKIFFAFIIVMILIFLIMWILANMKNEKNLKINSTNIVIKYGDLFEEEGLKVIAFNEFFDTQVDDKVITMISERLCESLVMW